MTLLADRVKESTTTTGTGPVTLAGAPAGFQSFNTAFALNDLVYYVIQGGAEWEIGIGTVGTGTLARTTVLQSSNADALVPFSAGVKDVFCSYVADRAVTTVDAATLTNKTIDDYTNNVGANSTHFRVKATGNFSKGAVLKATGFNPGEQALEVAVVSSATDLVLGIAEQTLTTGQFGTAVVIGELFDVNTNGLTVGQIIYSNGSGGFTQTKPSSGLYQALGWVVRANTNTGVIAVNVVAPLYVETSTNTANTSVLRDGSGNFAAGIITATLNGAAPAGSLTGTTLAANVVTSSLTSVGTLTSGAIGTGFTAIPDSALGTISTAGKVSNSATTATSANTPSAIVARDGSGNFSAGTITASLSGTATQVSQDLTAGTYLTSSGTYNGGTARTFAVDATDANTASKVVARDASGNFSAGTITATLNGAAPAGSLTGTTLAANVITSSLTSVGTLTSGAIGAGFTAIPDSALATISTAGKVSNSATTATSSNTSNAIVARDASGNFSAGTITATLSGAAPAGSLSGTTLAANVVSSSLTSVGTLANLTVTNPISGSVTGSSGSTTGNAATATALQTARNINGVSFNGTADITVTAAAGTLTGTTLASGVTASSLTSVGTLSSLTVSGNTILGSEVYRSSASSFMRLDGGTGSGSGANVIVFGESHATAPGRVSINATGSGRIDFSAGGALRAELDSSGNLAVDTNTLYVNAANNRVGIGTASPLYNLHISSASALGIQMTYEGSYASRLMNTSNGFEIGVDGSTGTNARLTINTIGNVGISSVPTAWATANGQRALEIGGFMALWMGANGGATMGFNVYESGVNAYTYRSANAATLYQQTNVHRWLIAPVGVSAGTPISFVQAMTLDSNANLGVGTGTGTINTRLHVQGANSMTSFTGSSYGAVIIRDGDAINEWAALDFSSQGDNPIARIGMQKQAGGSYLSFGTSNSYATGITNTAVTIDPSGDLWVGATSTGTFGRNLVMDGLTSTGLSLRVGGTLRGFMYADATTCQIGAPSAGSIVFKPNDVERARFDNPTVAGQTALLLYDVDNNTVERVTVGAADSGGTGFKVLRIPN